jgi:hypothetical protein
MEKNLKYQKEEATNLEIIYNNSEDLNQLSTKEEFKHFILEDSFKTIKRALKNNLDKVELFNLFNLSLVVELKKENYKDVLNNILEHYINEENYEKCSLIKRVITKYEI